jgi:formate hydrogenlyase transcriptional activator
MPGNLEAFGGGRTIPFSGSGALSEPDKLLGEFFQSASVGLSIVDADMRYLAINPALARMNRIPVADHLGKTIREMMGSFADIVEPNLRRVLDTGEPVLNFEVSAAFPPATEETHWIDHFFPIRNAVGDVTRVGVIVVEISEQKKLKDSVRELGGQLRRQMERLQVLVEISNLLASNWDVPQVFPHVSARIRRILRQEYASFVFHDENTGQLVRQAVDFPMGRGIPSAVPRYGADSPAGRALQQRTPLILSREQIESFDPDSIGHYLAEGFQSLCFVPMLRPKGALGAFVLGSTRKNAFQMEDLTLLNQVAAQFAIALENHRAATEIEALKERLIAEKKYLEGEIRNEGNFAEIIGESKPLQQILTQVSTVAGSDATVLILGPTGTGKELVARAIHRMSRRKDRPFIKVNCAAIPTGLLESELFGHEKGAFTGAILQKIGRMELANGGTLFLDEIGEIALDLQPKLLRVLQDHEFERLGGTRTIRVDLRLIAATNRDLARSVADREFRADLFYRLNVFPVRVPSLQERREDIPLLVRHFVRRFAERMNRHIETIPVETMQALKNWHWPGNIRELENLMERSVLLSDGPVLRVPLTELHSEADATPSRMVDSTLNSTEREHIIRILHDTHGVLSGPNGAAHRLGLKRTTLQSKMERLGITREDYSPKEK